jgi:hypothetical protein
MHANSSIISEMKIEISNNRYRDWVCFISQISSCVCMGLFFFQIFLIPFFLFSIFMQQIIHIKWCQTVMQNDDKIWDSK